MRQTSEQKMGCLATYDIDNHGIMKYTHRPRYVSIATSKHLVGRRRNRVLGGHHSHVGSHAWFGGCLSVLHSIMEAVGGVDVVEKPGVEAGGLSIKLISGSSSSTHSAATMGISYFVVGRK